MRIESIRLENFRNIREMLFEPCPGANIIYGENAQGKTNLLEAVWLFSGMRSFRGAKDADYIAFGEQRAALELGFIAEERAQTASAVFMSGRRSVRLNGVGKDSMAALAGVFCAVVFSPDHLSLVKEGPEKRRAMIDASLCQAYPKYGRILDSYDKARRQRGRLLKDIPMHSSLLDTLDAWDTHLVEYGAYISDMRARYVARLAEAAAAVYGGIAREREEFSAAYRPSFGGGCEGYDKAAFRERLRTELVRARADDIRTGTTSIGPHRDDVEILLSGVSARAFGSQGQQRSCVLALKLAECEILERRFGEPPVILLDDVMSELDDGRRAYLLGQLGERQALITCCDAAAFDGIRDGRVFRIQTGELSDRQDIS